MNELTVRNVTLQPGRPKVAVSLVGATIDEIIEECERAASMPCDIIEWRVDFFLENIEDLSQKLQSNEVYFDIIRILDEIRYAVGEKPVILTVRSLSNGGRIEMPLRSYRILWQLAAQSELVDIIDIELFDEDGRLDQEDVRKYINTVHKYNCLAMLSYHDPEATPAREGIINLAAIMKELGADICKIVTTAKDADDVKTLYEATSEIVDNDLGPIVAFCMGSVGQISRVACGRYGSCVTFAAGDTPSAPGQLPLAEMNELLDRYYGGQEQHD